MIQQEVSSEAVAEQGQEEQEQYGPLLVKVLEQHGIAAADCKKLQEVGVLILFGIVKLSFFKSSGWIFHCRSCCLRSKEEIDCD